MARKTKENKAKQIPQQQDLNTSAETTEGQTKSNRLPYILVFLFGFILYANTIPYEYVLDDKLYITNNSFTKKGFDGIGEIWTNDLMTGFFGTKKNLVEGGRYRPLALTTHAIEWQLFGESPAIGHFINVVLYGLTGWVLLAVLVKVFGWKEERWWWSVPFIAVMVYLSHPLHTEVTANIKSRDEILSLLFALLSFKAVLSYLDHRLTKNMAMAGLWFLLSLFSKESSVTFLGVAPLTLFFFPKGGLRDSIVAVSPLVAVSFLYLLIRLWVFREQGASLEVAKELMNKPYLLASESERLASIFFTMALYLKLLVWPHPLTHDYYPFHPFRTFQELMAGDRPYVDWSEPLALIGVVAYGLIVAYGLWAMYKKWKGGSADIIAFSGLIYFGTFILFSNLFFDIGAFMNERFLYIPSLGLSLIIAHLVVDRWSAQKENQLAMAATVILLLGFSAKTISRNTAWQSDRSLAMADVLTSDGSAKIKMTMGSEFLDLAKETSDPNKKMSYLQEGERYSLQSRQIYPSYFPPLDILGNIYFEMKRYDQSLDYFIKAVTQKPTDQRIRTNLEVVANTAKNNQEFELALKGYLFLTKVLKGADLARIYSSMGELYGKDLQDMQNAQRYLELAKQTNPADPGVYQKLGIVYAMTNRPDSALINLNKANELDPNNARILMNLGLLYNQIGRPNEGNAYLQQAYQIDPSIGRGN